VSPTAATPLALALVFLGLSPGAALAAAVLGAIVTPRTLRFVAHTWSATAAVAAALAAVALAIGLMLGIDAAGLAVAPIDLPGRLQDVCLLLLLTLAAASLWRHGLAHWLAALRGSDHGHEHGHGHGGGDDGHCHHR
jgi:hypothetical protein